MTWHEIKQSATVLSSTTQLTSLLLARAMLLGGGHAPPTSAVSPGLPRLSYAGALSLGNLLGTLRPTPMNREGGSGDGQKNK